MPRLYLYQKSLTLIIENLQCQQFYLFTDGDYSFILMKVKNQFIFMHKKEIWNVNIEEVEIREEFAFNMSPNAKKEIKKIIYQNFDLISESWNSYFKK